MQRLFVVLQYLLPHHLLSRLVGYLASCHWRIIKLPFMRFFIARYKVNVCEATSEDLNNYRNFNEFFTRPLKSGARPIEGNDNQLVSPADGTISQLGAIHSDQLVQAKGHMYSLVNLLGDAATAKLFRDGSFLTVYLSPRDYHRVHMPITGKLQSTVYMPGRLFSVNQVTTNAVKHLFTRNERLICLFETSAGPMAMVLVGAMIVAGIETVWAGKACPNHHGLQVSTYEQNTPPIQIVRGGEMGRFMMGSTVILMFGPGMVQLDTELHSGQAIKMGELIGSRLDTTASG